MGKAWTFGENMNTDEIIPGRHNITIDPLELAKNVFCEVKPEYARNVRPGDVIVGGQNFGCGSSREHAPIAIKGSQAKCVIATSFARIFFRNAINLGLLCVIADTDCIDESDELELDVGSETLRNKTKGQDIGIQIPSMMLRLYQEGGIIPYLKKHGLSALGDLERF